MKWKYLFIFICGFKYIQLQLSHLGKMKQNHKTEHESQVKYKNQFEHECIHHENYMIDKTSLEKWPELTNEGETLNCQKYIDTLFPEKDRRIVISAILVKKILHYERIVAEAVPLLGLQCEIFPEALQRKFITFIKSHRSDCLFLVRRFKPKTENVKITEEICQNRKYKFWSLRSGLPVDYNEAPNLKGRTRIAKYVNDDFGKRKEYEIIHLQDYTSNADDYKNWPELKRANIEKLCRELLHKIIPRTSFSELIVNVHKVCLQYTQMDIISIRRVLVSALRCQIPGKIRRGKFQFIRTSRAGCLHMTKHVSAFHSNYQITKLICDIGGLTPNRKRKHSEKDPHRKNSSELHEIKIE